MIKLSQTLATFHARVSLGAIAAVLAALPSAAAAVQTNIGVSVTAAGEFSHSHCEFQRVSGDGRYVVFTSRARNLAPDLAGTFEHVFRHDLDTRTTEVVSVDVNGDPQSACFSPDISEDGRYVVFISSQANLVAGDTNGVVDVFLRDMLAGTTELISLDSSGQQRNQGSVNPKVSADGRYVVFESDARFNSADVNGHADIYLRDRVTGTTEYVSLTQAGVGADSWCVEPEISDSGRYIAFRSRATNLGANSPQAVNIFWKDMTTGELRQADRSTAPAGLHFNSAWPAISGDGLTVSFVSNQRNLVPGDTDSQTDCFAYDVTSDTIEKISLRPDGMTASGSFNSRSAISVDGRFVAFSGESDDILPGGALFAEQVYLRDRVNGTTQRISVAWYGGPANRDAFDPQMDGSAHTVTVVSAATNIMLGYGGSVTQIFARDLRRDIGTPYCSGVVNSAGLVGRVDALGFTEVDRNVVTLESSSLPPSVLTIFLASLDQGFVAQPGGSAGNLCLGGAIGRYVRSGEVLNSGATGNAKLRIDLTDLPQPLGSIAVTPGTTVFFQGWHRDAVAGTATSNFTRGLAIGFQ